MNVNLLNTDINTNGIYRAMAIKESNDVTRIFIPQNQINPINTDGTLNIDIYNENKLIYPEALWCSQSLKELTPNSCIPCWIIYEAGDKKRPIILGFFGKGLNMVDISYTNNNTNDLNNQDNSNTNISQDYDINTTVDNPLNIGVNWIYPLSQRHTVSPLGSVRYFGASRSGGKRAHAGIDLIVPPNVNVIAMTSGVVKYISYGFYLNTDAIMVKNNDGTWINYGECKPHVKEGQSIKQGEIIGHIIRNTSSQKSSMLHTEVYVGGYDSHPLTNNGNYKYVPQRVYKRRCDLYDPTFVMNLPMK